MKRQSLSFKDKYKPFLSADKAFSRLHVLTSACIKFWEELCRVQKNDDEFYSLFRTLVPAVIL